MVSRGYVAFMPAVALNRSEAVSEATKELIGLGFKPFPFAE